MPNNPTYLADFLQHIPQLVFAVTRLLFKLLNIFFLSSDKWREFRGWSSSLQFPANWTDRVFGCCINQPLILVGNTCVGVFELMCGAISFHSRTIADDTRIVRVLGSFVNFQIASAINYTISRRQFSTGITCQSLLINEQNLNLNLYQFLRVMHLRVMKDCILWD